MTFKLIECEKDCPRGKPEDVPYLDFAAKSNLGCLGCKTGQLIRTGRQLQKAEAEIERLKKEISLHADALCKVSNAASMAMDDVEYWICDFDSERPEDIDEVQKVVDEYRIGAYHGKQTGQWTTTPPTEPGWYKVHADKGGYKEHGKKGGFAFREITGKGDQYIEPWLDWYSEKEIFPPLPDEKE